MKANSTNENNNNGPIWIPTPAKIEKKKSEKKKPFNAGGQSSGPNKSGESKAAAKKRKERINFE